jgi:hypothetical protein
VVPKSFKFSLLPTDSVILDHVVKIFIKLTEQSRKNTVWNKMIFI